MAWMAALEDGLTFGAMRVMETTSGRGEVHAPCSGASLPWVVPVSFSGKDLAFNAVMVGFFAGEMARTYVDGVTVLTI